jgi:3-oxoacyl-[acyl-carrier protein] reductase
MTTSGSGRLAGTVVVVTGAGQGIGRGLALRLAAEGCSVVVADINGEAARRVAEELPGFGIAVEVDVSEPGSVEFMRDTVLDRFGTVDVLVNNAAVFSTLALRPFDEIPVDEWDRVMGVNVRGMFLCSRAFVGAMRQAGHGKIINITSATFFVGRPFYLHYVTSKSAVIGLTRALAAELGPAGITVNAIAPGAVQTEVPRETITQAELDAIVARQSIRRPEAPDDVARVLAFLVSADSDFMTGQTMVVDGGAIFH